MSVVKEEEEEVCKETFLPSEEEAKSSLAPFLTTTSSSVDVTEGEEAAATPWKEVVLRCLSYSTDYNVIEIITKEEIDKRESLNSRYSKCLSLLSDCLSYYRSSLDQLPKQQQQQQEEERKMEGGGVSPLNILVDSVWLVGTLLEPNAENPSKSKYNLSSSSSSSYTANYKQKCYESLTSLIHALASSSSTLHTLFQKTLEPFLLAKSNLLPSPGPTTTTTGKTTTTPSSSSLSVSFMLKRMKKINTDLFYRQTKFNLLQEECEGYAKLLAFFTSLHLFDDDHDDHHHDEHHHHEKEEEEENEERENKSVKAAVIKVREIIGTFDLDPNRVLDLTLDVLEFELHNFLSSSSSSSTNSKKKKQQQTECCSLTEKLKNAPNYTTTFFILLEIMSQFNLSSVPHLLGVKYASYYSFSQHKSPFAPPPPSSSSSDNNNKEEIKTPTSLYLLTALLTLHSKLNLQNLLPHLQPYHSSSLLSTYYTTLQSEYKSSIQKMGIISLNKKTTSEEEKEENNTNNKSEEEEEKKKEEAKKEELIYQNNQIIGIVQMLLQLNGWKDVSLFVQTLFQEEKENGMEVLCGVYPEIANLVCGYVESTIEPLYIHKVLEEEEENTDERVVWTELCPSSALTTKKNQVEDESISLLPPNNVPNATKTTLEELVNKITEPIEAIVPSGCIKAHPLLYCKLCRLVSALLQQEFFQQLNSNTSSSKEGEAEDEEKKKNNSISSSTFYLLQTFLVPSLSLYPSNPALCSELWSVLSLLPYTLRYKLYAKWRGTALEKASFRSLATSKKPLPLIQSEVQTGLSTRATLKRLSKDNVKHMGRQLSKYAHNNPLVVFTKILNQIESYDNLIVMMVETFRFVSVLGLDVLSFCLLVALGGEEEEEDEEGGAGGGGGDRSKLKMDGVNVTQWLSSLSTFTGAFYKKFPDVELRGILQYLTHRLRKGYILELGVLRSLLKTAGGYGFADCSSTTASLSEVQLQGRCGSQLLKRETSSFGIVEKSNKKASKRLRCVLQQDDLGVIILILLSQIRFRVMFHVTKSSPKHIKLIGNLYDNCVVVMGLMLEFLTDLSDDSSASSSAAVVQQGGKKDGGGGSSNSAIAKYASSLPTLGELHDKYGVDTAVSWMLARPPVRVALLSTEENEETNTKNKTNVVPPFLQRFQPDNPEMQKSYSSMLPEEAWKAITPALFESFYSLSLSDVVDVEERYTTEITRLKKEEERLTQVQQGSGEAARAAMATQAAAAAAAGGSRQEVQQAVVFTKSQEQELERVKRNADALTADKIRQKKHCEAVRLRLESRKHELLTPLDKDDVAQFTTQTFLTHCVYPRSLLSPEDAMFCAHFVILLHTLETPGFQTMQYINGLVDAVVGALYCITEDEAGNIGVLLAEMWKLVSRWRYDEKVFEKEVMGKPGSFITKENDASDGDGDNNNGTEEKKPITETVSFNDFKTLYNRWHATIGEAAMGCLKSSEYMHTRAALIVLNRMVRVYPTRPVLGEKIFTVLEPLQGDENPRPDIRAMAQAYGSQLAKARDDGVWTEQDDKVTKARIEKEKMEMEERRKKAEKQLEEMNRESDQITHHIGDSRTRNPRFQPRGGDPRGGHYPDRGAPHGTPHGSSSRAMLNPSAATFTPPNGGAARDLHPHSSASYPSSRSEGPDRRDHAHEWTRRGDRDSRDHSSRGGTDGPRRSAERGDHHTMHSDTRSHKWERDRGSAAASAGSSRGGGAGGASQQQQTMDSRGSDRDPRYSGNLDSRHQHQSNRGGSSSAGLAGRWERGGGGSGPGEREGGSAKRSRSPNEDGSSGMGGNERGEIPSKRIRTQPPSGVSHDRGDRSGPGSSNSPPPSRGGSGGGGGGVSSHGSDHRRGDGRVRGASPPRGGRYQSGSQAPPHIDRGGSRRPDRRSGPRK